MPLETWPLDRLKPDVRNARTHSEAQVAYLAASIREFGFTNPILAAPDGTIIAGHGRRLAALQVGLPTVPVITLGNLTETQRRALALADNRIPERGGWDEDLLAAELEALKADGFDLESVGFTDEELDDAKPQRWTYVETGKLKRHPRNYRQHPEDQLDHIVASIKAHGFYRNVVAARDLTVLAGHGVVDAARKMGTDKVPVIILDLDPNEPRALKVLASDNEIAKLAESDDRALSEMLRELMESEGGLLGTGFNEQQLAALAMVTRPASEIRDKNEAAEWLGMPEYEEGATPIKLVITFLNEEDRQRFIELIGLRLDKNAIKGTTYSTRWPWTDREATSSIRFEQQPAEDKESTA